MTVPHQNTCDIRQPLIKQTTNPKGGAYGRPDPGVRRDPQRGVDLS
ncbi:MAG: hypothetical protein RL367_292, partial [Pseudomonadota bacterium]